MKRDGRLLLRHPGVVCANLSDYVEQSTVKPMHFRENLAGERASIRAQLKQKKAVSVEILDDDGNTNEPINRKRTMDYDLRPSQRLRLSSPCTPSRLAHLGPSPHSGSESSPAVIPLSFTRSPSLVISSPHPRFDLDSLSGYESSSAEPPTPPSFIRSPSLVASSPRPRFDYDIVVPNSTKPWPDGMYTKDMAAAFLAVDDKSLKKTFSRLEDRIKFVLKKPVHRNTWNDQRRRWNAATEEERDIFQNAGRTSEGLWSKFSKTSRSH